MMRSERRWALLAVAPATLGLAVFVLLPILATLAISWFAWDVLTAPRWVGTANVTALFADVRFWDALANTARFVAASVTGGLILALAVALAIEGLGRGRTIVRIALIMPICASSVATSLAWRWFLNTDFGLANSTMGSLGLAPVPWLSSTEWAMVSLVAVAIWKGIGYDVILFVAGLQSVPTHLHDAARLDGADAWQRFRAITLPMLSPTTSFVFVIATVRAAQAFDLVYVLTGGGPADATLTLTVLIYQLAFQFFQFGYAAAIAWVLFLVVAGLMLLRPRVPDLTE